MRRLLLGLLAGVTLLLSAAASGQAPAPPKLTWVRFYVVPENGAATLVNGARAALQPLLASKKIVAYGIVEPVSRVGDPYTHAVFVSVAGWSSLDDVVAALGSGPSHAHDVVLRHIVFSETPPAPDPKFLMINMHPISRGRDSDAFALFNEWAKPIFSRIAAKGKLGPWGLSVQSIVLDNQWTYMVWYFMTDLSVLDEIDSELFALGPSKIGTYERRLREMSEDDYIGQLMRVIYAAP